MWMLLIKFCTDFDGDLLILQIQIFRHSLHRKLLITTTVVLGLPVMLTVSIPRKRFSIGMLKLRIMRI